LNIKVVLVHGIGKQLKAFAQERNLPILDPYGQGPTDPLTLEAATKVIGQVGNYLGGGLTQVGLNYAITNALRAVPMGVIRGVDQQLTGKIEKVDVQLIQNLLQAGIVPLFQPIVYDRLGQPYRVNS